MAFYAELLTKLHPGLQGCLAKSNIVLKYKTAGLSILHKDQLQTTACIRFSMKWDLSSLLPFFLGRTEESVMSQQVLLLQKSLTKVKKLPPNNSAIRHALACGLAEVPRALLTLSLDPK